MPRPRTGELADFTGVSAPSRRRSTRELRLRTEGEEPANSAARVIDRLVELGLVAPGS